MHRAQPPLRPPPGPRGVRGSRRGGGGRVARRRSARRDDAGRGRWSPARRWSAWKAVALGQEEGARVVAGGRRPDGGGLLKKGNFLMPTVLDGVRNRMRVAQEEIFGPVLSVIDFESLDDVIREANDISYGLGASIWTRDISVAHTVARRLKAGNISINHPTVNYIYAPFGGYKQSGLERKPVRTGSISLPG
ncbi:MAG: aldehyde dehydrogenase family protein [Thermomicrobiales bacterium]